MSLMRVQNECKTKKIIFTTRAKRMLNGPTHFTDEGPTVIGLLYGPYPHTYTAQRLEIG